MFARWWGWVCGLAGLVQIVGATAWARDGVWSPTGGATFVCFVAFLGWLLVTSGMLAMQMREETVHYTAATA